MKENTKIVIKILIGLILIILIGLFRPAAALAPEQKLQDRPLPDIVRYFADQYDFSPEVLLKVMECESHGDQSVLGDGGRAVGIYQIHQETWNRFTKGMGETLDRDSAFDQAKVAAYAFSHGHANEWTTFRAIMNGGTYSFYSKLLQKHFTVVCKL